VSAFAEIVDEARALLPARIDRLLDDELCLVLKDKPDAADLARGASPDLAGYFYGRARPDPELEDDEGPRWDLEPVAGGVVALFAGNIRPQTADRVAIVLLHEIGHYLGFDETELVEGMGLS